MTYIVVSFFFVNDTATTEIYTLSLHDALPIWNGTDGSTLIPRLVSFPTSACVACIPRMHEYNLPLSFIDARRRDRKSTRLNSSHANISYAVFCLKKKKE